MKSLGLRVTAVLLAIVALAGAGFVVFTAEPKAVAAEAARRDFEADVARAQVVVADLRAAMPAYLAPSQDPSFWTRRVGELLQALDARLKALERPGVGTATLQEIGTAEEAAATLRECDDRLKTLVRQQRQAEASRLVFSDVNALASAAAVALSQAGALERSAREAEIASLRRRELLATAGAAGVGLVVLLLLFPLPTRTGDEAREGAEAAPAGDGMRLFGGPLELDSLGRSGFDLLDLDGESSPRAERPAPTPPAPAPPAPPTAPPSTATAAAQQASPATPAPAPAGKVPGFAWSHAGAPAPGPAAPDLAEAAKLCTELAQVSDTDQLRQLLGRAATLLHASGIVVWLGGVGGARLRPAFSHGYAQQTLARMQEIDRADENAVSAAYRSGRIQAVAADERGTSALVAPLLVPAGCVGAMAVEIVAGAEQDQALRALAQLVAAQIATLMPTDS